MNKIPREQAEKIARRVLLKQQDIYYAALDAGMLEQCNEAFEYEYVRLMADLIQDEP